MFEFRFENADDEQKLEMVRDFSSKELYIILEFLENGMFYDRNGQPYTRRYLTERANNKFGID